MSNNIIKLIPTSPYYAPDAEHVSKVGSLAREAFPLADDVKIETSGMPRFVDQGTNWEKLICSKCNSEISEVWWQGAMDEAFTSGFSNLIAQVPCCGEMISLNDLEYFWPAGFARFSIEICNPNSDISPNILDKFEAIIGSTLRKIWARY